MTLGDVEKAGRLLIKLQERMVSLEKEYDESMVHQNNQYNRRVAERDAALVQVDRLKAEIFTYQRSFSAFKEDVEKSPKQRTGNCLLTGVCASEGHRIKRSSQAPLTDDQIKEFSESIWGSEIDYQHTWEIEFARAIEAAHGIGVKP